MTATQITAFKAIRSEITAARNAYHAALAAKAPAATRVKAEKACTAAMDKMTAFQAAL